MNKKVIEWAIESGVIDETLTVEKYQAINRFVYLMVQKSISIVHTAWKYDTNAHDEDGFEWDGKDVADDIANAIYDFFNFGIEKKGELK